MATIPRTSVVKLTECWAHYVIPNCKTDVSRVFISVTFIRKWTAVTCFDREWNCIYQGNMTRELWEQQKHIATERGSRLLQEISHCWETEMCTVHRNRTHSRRYIRNVYCAKWRTVVVGRNNVNWSFIYIYIYMCVCVCACVCVWALLTPCSFVGHKSVNGFVI
jgi:hypothetical protein